MKNPWTRGANATLGSHDRPVIMIFSPHVRYLTHLSRKKLTLSPDYRELEKFLR